MSLSPSNLFPDFNTFFAKSVYSAEMQALVRNQSVKMLAKLNEKNKKFWVPNEHANRGGRYSLSYFTYSWNPGSI